MGHPLNFYTKNDYIHHRFNTTESKVPKNLTKIEHMNDILDKVLEIAEFIIRDPKYKKHIENSSRILNDFLNLIEKVENKYNFTFPFVVILIILLGFWFYFHLILWVFFNLANQKSSSLKLLC